MPKLSYTSRRSMRLNDPARFKAMYADAARITRGPLKLFAKPNGLEHARLGISIGRRAGTAPRRNRIKRLLREAFRLMQHDWPTGYDLVIVVRPHEPLILAEYQRALSGALVKLVAGSDEATRSASSGQAPRRSDEGNR